MRYISLAMTNCLQIMMVIAIIFPVARASFINNIESEARCIGSLIIGHEDEDWNINYLRIEGYPHRYRNIRRRFPVIRANVVSTIEIIGNCCWELYSGLSFKGERQTIFPTGEEISVDFQPFSIKRLECFQ